MTTSKIATAVSIAFLSATPVLAQDVACTQIGADSPLKLHKHWIMEGWEKREGDPEFVFAKKMERYYDLQDPTGVFYDNFAPGASQLFHNAAIYGANWEGLQAEARTVLHALTEGHDGLVGENVASTTIGFVGIIARLDGVDIPFNGRSQLGWECDAGTWKIRQEMNYAWPVTSEEIAHYYDAVGNE